MLIEVTLKAVIVTIIVIIARMIIKDRTGSSTYTTANIESYTSFMELVDGNIRTSYVVYPWDIYVRQAKTNLIRKKQIALKHFIKSYNIWTKKNKS